MFIVVNGTEDEAMKLMRDYAQRNPLFIFKVWQVNSGVYNIVGTSIKWKLVGESKSVASRETLLSSLTD